MDDPNDALREFQRAEETRRAAAAWLQAFEAALGSRDAGRIAALFQADAHWRDVLAFTWNFSAAAGRDEIAARLAAEQPRVGAQGFHLPPGRRA
ncbi:MAG: monooxygenase, partial [Acetobacteraceae bacterium]